MNSVILKKLLKFHKVHNLKLNVTDKRDFFRWLIPVFNRPNLDRIKEVGPDRACAEWLLRNGAFVKWKNNPEYLKNYNNLPDESESNHIQGVDATDSAIHHVGFPHFKGCKYIEEFKIVRCCYISNEALPLLSLLKESLRNLEVIECQNVTDSALLELKALKKLSSLKMGGMPYVQDKNKIVAELAAALPECKITYY